MQTTDSRPLHHHFPAFDVPLHAAAGERERGGSGGEKSHEETERKPSALWEASDPEACGKVALMTPLFTRTWRLLAEGWEWRRGGGWGGGRDGAGCGRDT